MSPLSSATLPDRFEKKTFTPSQLTPNRIAAATKGIADATASARLGRDRKRVFDNIMELNERLSDESIPDDYRQLLSEERQIAIKEYESLPWMPDIDSITRTYGEATAASVIKLMLIKLNIETNPTRPLTEAHIEAMAPMVVRHMVESSVTFTVADIKILFETAAMGKYGKLYGGFGLQDICQWIDAYELEKITAIDRIEEERRCRDEYDRTSGRDERQVNHAAAVWYQQQRTKNDDNTQEP